jgi:hypothetical protein
MTNFLKFTLDNPDTYIMMVYVIGFFNIQRIKNVLQLMLHQQRTKRAGSQVSNYDVEKIQSTACVRW